MIRKQRKRTSDAKAAWSPITASPVACCSNNIDMMLRKIAKAIARRDAK